MQGFILSTLQYAIEPEADKQMIILALVSGHSLLSR